MCYLLLVLLIANRKGIRNYDSERIFESGALPE